MAEVDVTHKVVAFIPSQRYREDMSASELYEITRGVWKLNLARVQQSDYVFCVIRKEVKAVYRVKYWLPAGTLHYHTRTREDVDIAGRWEFYGEVAEKEVRDRYLGKQVKRSHGASVLYFNC